MAVTPYIKRRQFGLLAPFRLGGAGDIHLDLRPLQLVEDVLRSLWLPEIFGNHARGDIVVTSAQAPGQNAM